jgi:hypothetical protein
MTTAERKREREKERKREREKERKREREKERKREREKERKREREKERKREREKERKREREKERKREREKERERQPFTLCPRDLYEVRMQPTKLAVSLKSISAIPSEIYFFKNLNFRIFFMLLFLIFNISIKIYNKYDQLASSFCHQVAAWVDMFCTFYLTENHKSAHNSTTTIAMERISTDLKTKIF